MDKIQHILQIADDAEDNPLKCSICKHFLSVPPIVLNSTLGSICGREVCRNLATSEGTNYRQSAYEELAKDLEFPCMYRKNGCKEVSSWNEFGEHEINCKYLKLSCPFLTDGFEGADQICEWEGNTSEVLAHMEGNHSPHKFSNHLEVSLPDIKKNKLWFSRIQDSIIIVLVVIDDKTDTHWKVWTVPEIWKNFNYKIEISSEQGQSSLTSKFQKAELLYPSFFRGKTDNSWFKMNFNCITNFTDAPCFLTTKCYMKGFLISPWVHRSYLDRINKILLLLKGKCDVCKGETFGMYVFVCESDHKICSRCEQSEAEDYKMKYNKQGSFCRLCKPRFSKSLHRNIDNWTLLNNQLIINCILCNTKFYDLSNHLYNKHPEYIFKLGESHHFKLKHYFFSFAVDIFLLSKNIDSNRGLTFSVQCLRTRTVKYKYKLELSSEGSCSAITFANFCSPDLADLQYIARESWDGFSHETVIPKYLFTSFFPNANFIRFKLDISTL